MLGTILIIILILALIGAPPTWGHSRSWGYYPSGGLGLVLVIIIILVLIGRIWRHPGRRAPRARGVPVPPPMIDVRLRSPATDLGGQMTDTATATPSLGSWPANPAPSSADRPATWSSGTTGSPTRAFSIYFAKIFFPKGDQTAQLMQTAAIFAVGFGARPVGAWLMGLYADRKGRKAGLTLAVGLMCVGSLIIALCPGHATIGDAAPVILLLARLLQGLSVGGEYGASATYMSEMAGRKRRGFWSSFQYVTLIMGQLVAALVLVILQNTLSKEDLAEWGWRIPFFVGAALAVVVFWIRTGIEESISAPERRHRPLIRSAAARSTWVSGLLAGHRRGHGRRASPRRRSPRRRQYAAVALLVATYVALAAPWSRAIPSRPWRSSA